MIDQPYFRFNPNAYLDGRAFQQSTDVCDGCQKPCVWEYVGSIYALETPRVCARCISDGQVAHAISIPDYDFHDINLVDAEPELGRELLQRTPGVACFNPFDWPVLGGKPCAFIGYGDEAFILADSDMQDAIVAAFGEVGVVHAAGTPTPYALVFRELEGVCYLAVIDVD